MKVRFFFVDFDDFTLINSYFPTVTSGEARQEKKEEYLELVAQLHKRITQNDPNSIFSGDIILNIKLFSTIS
jgi:exodeoxyribonuclease-3